MDSSPRRSDISKRILETRKQTEELKAQLQNLIDSGINSLDVNKASEHFNFDKENVKESQNKVQIIKSYDAKYSRHVNKPSSSNIVSVAKQTDKNAQASTKQESQKKIRSYDVNEAREYIKKQREKRLEQAKSQKNEKIKAELQKQKLLELHKKSLELVTKNVQAKRERSKSRERTDYIRPDQNVPTRNRSSSRERNFPGGTKLHSVSDYKKCGKLGEHSKNLKFETVERIGSSDYMARKQKTKSESSQVEGPTPTSSKEPCNSDQNKKMDNDSSKHSLILDSNVDIRRTSLKPVNLFNQPHSKSGTVKEESQNIKKSTENQNFLPVSNILDYKSSKIDCNPTLQTPKVNLEPTKINLAQSNALISDQGHDYRKPKSKQSEVATGTDNLEKDSKETQTNVEKKIEFPLWLQEKPVQAYPFNFINTVKRKLQYAVNIPKPSAVEIGVQSSFVKEISEPQTPGSTKTKEQILEFLQHSTKSSKKSDLNSFISHKGPNLDSKPMDHLELVPRKSIHRTPTVTKISETESESDTSKNIPDISSEIDHSLKKSTESVKQNGTSILNIERISSMKLVPHGVKSATTTIQSEVGRNSSEVGQTEFLLKPTRNSKSRSSESRDTVNRERESRKTNSIRTVENQYSSDFQSGSESSKSRKSIISFNAPTYNKLLVHSHNRDPEDWKSVETDNSLHTENHSIYIPESISLHSKIIPESITLRNGDQQKYSKSISNVTTKRDRTEDIVNSIPSRTTEPRNSSSSRKLTNGGITTSNGNENSSSISIATERESHTSDRNSEESDKVLSKSSIQNSKRSENYTSLYTETYPSANNISRLSKSESNLQNINTRRGSGTFSESDKLTEVLPLKEPMLSLTIAKKETKGKYDGRKRSKLTKNIALRPDRNREQEDFNDTNEIHLKFEAEIHLLNDFNESLRQFSAVEKAFESLKSKNDSNVTLHKILQNRDTQTSMGTKSSTSTKIAENLADTTKSQISTINYSRGSVIDIDLSNLNLDTTVSKQEETDGLVSTGMEISNLNKSMSTVAGSNQELSNFENLQSGNFAGMSLRMFEQLIKDEDVRLENLKTILKIREQALLDRTKGELAWLEIQRKHLRETGKLHEASLIKKKQRGILVNHQKEKHEMQRLKQMQKAASLERKIILKEQRNLIKHQLSTDNMLSKMKVNTPRERRLSGPLKVVQSHTESIRSETSISRRSSSDKDKDVYSITSHTHSVVSKVSEVSGDDVRSRDVKSDVDVVDLVSKVSSEGPGVPISKMKRSLLMREAALQKRRRAAEELLQWHKKLLEEERRITELELAANAIISHIPNNALNSTDVEEKYKFKGKQLNQLWFNLTGCEVKKFAEEKIYPMSQIALERFCKSARQYSAKTKKILRKVSDSDVNSDYSGPRSEDSVSENIPDQKDALSASIRMEVEQSHKQTSSRNEVVPTATLNEYTSDFDVESLEEIVNEDMDIVDQSINRLISNFSKIKEDISSLSLKQSLKSDESQKSEKTDSDVEISVIETNRTSKEEEEKSEEEVILRLTSEAPVSTSNKNSSTLEEIRNDLSKSEEVLLKLREAELSNSRTSSLIDEHLVASAEESKLSKIDDEIVLSLKNTQNTISSIVSEVDSNKTSSEVQEDSKDYGSASREKENLSLLSKTEDRISTDVSSNKNASINHQHQITCEEKDNLNETEQVPGQLDEKISTATSSIERSPTIEESHVSIENEDNSMENKDILQSPSEVRVSTDVSEDDVLSGNKSMVMEENQLSAKGKDNLGKSEEILLRLSQSEGKVSTDVPSIISSSQMLVPIAGNELSNESKDNLSKTEEILAKLSQGVYRTSIDASNDAFASRSSVIGEDSSSYIDELNKSEDILLRMQQEKGSGDGYSHKISSPTEGAKPYSQKHRAEKNLVKVNQEDRTSIVSTRDVSTSKKATPNESEDSHKDRSAVEDEKQTDKEVTAEISDKTLDSFKETDVDEELSVDEEPKSKNAANLEQQIRTSPIEESSHIKDGEDMPEENDHEMEISQVNDKETVLTDQISKEVTSTNRDISSEPIIITESKDESESKGAESIISGKTYTGKSSTKASEKAQLSKVPEQNTSNKEDLSLHTASDVYTEFEETNKSAPLSKEDKNSYEEKEQDSLSSSATSGSQTSVVTEKDDKSTRSKSCSSEQKSPKRGVMDVKKRVSEIMADASQLSRGDKSPRVQDLYVTTYDLVSPANSPELGSPTEENKLVAAKSVFGTEAEELLRKQLAIEQEIKQITEQQQKEQLPYLFVREIPNKPPPPYIPPSSLPPVNVITIVPTTDEIEEISKYSAKILHKAYLSHNLDNISISENTLGLISKDITKECYKFVFDLCKEISKEHYKQFEKEKCPSWLQVTKKPQLTVVRPLDVGGLERHLIKNLKELFGYEKPERRENAIIKWSRKNRDHVDEILVMESQVEEAQWTNYDKDELLIMNEATNEIMNMLLKETGQVFNKILSKRTYLY